jgi:S-adenosylmethionine:tRNA ribosyltransferase-isomerase
MSDGVDPAETLSDYDYDLPSNLIAQEPPATRGTSRLLVVNRSTGELIDSDFSSLSRYLSGRDMLVVNESRVIPARVFGHLESGAAVELLLVDLRTGGSDHVWEAMARPAKKLRPGTTILLPEGVIGVVESFLPRSRRAIRITGVDDVTNWLARVGRLPIPPYIKSYPDDPERYQTIFARTAGSIAAPTAGLHFTNELLEALQGAGVEVLKVLLHVGPGTFQSLREENLNKVGLEAEVGVVTADTARRLNQARREGKRIIAVGTTTTRLLEGAYGQLADGDFEPFEGSVDLFIRPPHTFNVIAGLLTNFHLPRSSLLMLVSAFAGRDLVRAAYAHAIEDGYRFFSFGDAMLIL